MAAFALDDELQSAEERLALEEALSFMDQAFGASLTDAPATAAASLSPLYLFDQGEQLQQQQQQQQQQLHLEQEQRELELQVDQELQLFDIESGASEVDLLALEAFTTNAVASHYANMHGGDAGGDEDDAMDELSFHFASSSDTSASPSPRIQIVEEVEETASVAKPRQKRRQKQQTQTKTQLSAATSDTKTRTRTSSKNASGGTVTTIANSSGSRSSRKPLNYNPNKARDERREELIYLRGKVQELETQLDDIKQKRPRITASALAPTLPTVSFSSTLSFPSSVASAGVQPKLEPPTSDQQQQQQQLVVAGVWQDIATRQCEGRIKAERENIRLKIILENQIKIAKSLEKLLKKKVAARDIEHCPQCQQLHHVYPPTKDPRTDAQIFEDLAKGVELSYKEVDSVFAANGLAQMEIPHSDARMRSDDAHGMFLEILANKVLPFDVHATATAAWHYFVYAKQRMPSRSYFFDSPKVAETTDDTIMENFSLGMHANSTSAHFRVKQVLKRFVEENRVVITWRSHIEPVEFSDEPLSDLRFRERGYIVIKRPRTLSGDYTLVQTCYMFTPNFTGDLKAAIGGSGGGGSGDHPKVCAITDFVLSATAANITASHQMIENVLIEQAMKKHDGGGGVAVQTM